MSSTAATGAFEEINEAIEMFDLDYFLDLHGIKHKKVRGRSGLQLNVKTCPVCGNDKHKVFLNAETGLGNCFAGSHPAGENFNKWKFIRACFSSFSEAKAAIMSIAAESGWAPRAAPEPVKAIAAEDWRLPPCLDLPHEGIYMPLYLTQRGITPAVAAYFGLKWCEAGYYLDDLGTHDYSGRVIIPICDLDGRMQNFQGRDATGTSSLRYLFPAGLPATGKYLYNGQNCIGCTSLVICEGAFDVFGAHIALQSRPDTRSVGVVGSFGVSLSTGSEDGQDQLTALKRLIAAGTKDIVFMWDGEQAAMKQALAAGLHLRSLGIPSRIALLPQDTDPGEAPPEAIIQAYFQARLITPALSLQLSLAGYR